MRKIEKLKKRVIVEASIAGGFVAAAIGVLVFAIHLTDTQKDALAQVKQMTRTELVKLEDFNKQIEKTGISSQVYEEVVGRKVNLNFILDRTALRNALGQLKEKYRLSHLAMEVTPSDKYTNKELEALSIEAQQMRVKLNLSAMSDTHIYSFMQDMQQSLPGFVKPVIVTIKRERKMDVDALSQMKAGNSPPMVSCVIEFMWYGFKPPAPVEAPHEG